jgi:hypothetical protein
VVMKIKLCTRHWLSSPKTEAIAESSPTNGQPQFSAMDRKCFQVGFVVKSYFVKFCIA